MIYPALIMAVFLQLIETFKNLSPCLIHRSDLLVWPRSKTVSSSMHNRYYEKIGNSESKCIDDEIPFDIPKSWNWVRLKTIGDWGAGATPPRGNLEYSVAQ